MRLRMFIKILYEAIFFLHVNFCLKLHWLENIHKSSLILPWTCSWFIIIKKKNYGSDSMEFLDFALNFLLVHNLKKKHYGSDSMEWLLCRLAPITHSQPFVCLHDSEIICTIPIFLKLEWLYLKENTCMYLLL